MNEHELLDLDPAKLTIQQLTSILSRFNVNLPTSRQKKDVYVRLFRENISENPDFILRELENSPLSNEEVEDILVYTPSKLVSAINVDGHKKKQSETGLGLGLGLGENEMSGKIEHKKTPRREPETSEATGKRRMARRPELTATTTRTRRHAEENTMNDVPYDSMAPFVKFPDLSRSAAAVKSKDAKTKHKRAAGDKRYWGLTFWFVVTIMVVLVGVAVKSEISWPTHNDFTDFMGLKDSFYASTMECLERFMSMVPPITQMDTITGCVHKLQTETQNLFSFISDIDIQSVTKYLQDIFTTSRDHLSSLLSDMIEGSLLPKFHEYSQLLLACATTALDTTLEFITNLTSTTKTQSMEILKSSTPYLLGLLLFTPLPFMVIYFRQQRAHKQLVDIIIRESIHTLRKYRRKHLANPIEYPLSGLSSHELQYRILPNVKPTVEDNEDVKSVESVLDIKGVLLVRYHDGGRGFWVSNAELRYKLWDEVVEGLNKVENVESKWFVKQGVKHMGWEYRLGSHY